LNREAIVLYFARAATSHSPAVVDEIPEDRAAVDAIKSKSALNT
jgi:hypothetical protein